MHDRYHVFEQYNECVVGHPGCRGGWCVAVVTKAFTQGPDAGRGCAVLLRRYHFVSQDLVRWTRLGVDPTHNVSSCSGGATLAPDGTPTLIFCPGATAVPLNRSDPMLRQWVQNNTDVTGAAFFPPNITGKWDGSVVRDATSGRYVTTFGSCDTRGGTACSTPQILSYASSNLRSWQYLGEQWRYGSPLWPMHVPLIRQQSFTVPRIECPYQWQDSANRTVLKLSLPGTGPSLPKIPPPLASASSARVC